MVRLYCSLSLAIPVLLKLPFSLLRQRFDVLFSRLQSTYFLEQPKSVEVLCLASALHCLRCPSQSPVTSPLLGSLYRRSFE
ncbi:hypothetical protein E2C01_044005 [Portunus trituberculatus]|uniref:Uncharacterized protein n=1 Tax=Portunus trituberculatus TaxID=210409 RepID=A0A5B7FUF0_PORTR|nr:hypothetical protein [Portunus trituberculatus]